MSNTIQIPDPESADAIHLWVARRMSIELLAVDIAPSDSHEEEGAMMTVDRQFYFIPCPDDLVRTPRTLRHPEGEVTDSPMWRIEVVKCIPGGRHEPDDYDFDEEGDRQPSLSHAIVEAARLELECKIASIGEGIFWEGERHRVRLNPYPKEDC